MINSVSGVSFRGDVAPAGGQDLISAPSKYSAAQAPDSFEKSDAVSDKKKRNTALKIAGAVVGLAALTYAALGLAVGKGKLTKAVAEAGQEVGFMGKVKNFFVSIGENAVSMWNKVFGKNAEKAAEAVAEGTEAAAK